MSVRNKLILLSALLLLIPLTGIGETFTQRLKNKIVRLANGGTVMVNSPAGKSILAHHSDKKLIPASIIKYATSLAALALLGEDYRFKTEFYLNEKQELLIRGLGDPFLVSEEIQLIAGKLRELGLREVQRIYIDTSAFEKVTIPGASTTLNPYDAPNGALVVNFNTVFLRRAKNGRISSAEEITPLTPIAKNKGPLIKRGTEERVRLSPANNEPVRYGGELFIAFFRQAGMAVRSQKVSQTKVNASWKRYYTHRNSRPLPELITGLMRFSNNFIANQIYLTIGAKEKGYPATLEKATETVQAYLYKHLKLSRKDLYFDEGSGLSRNSRVTGKAMMRLVEEFKPHAHLLAREKYGALVKSGTLKGVYNYAGYIKQEDDALLPFVIMINNSRNTRNRVLKLLKNYCEHITERNPDMLISAKSEN